MELERKGEMELGRNSVHYIYDIIHTILKIGVCMTIRKNFTMPDSVVEDLEYIAKATHKKQSQVIQDLITEKMKEYAIQKKLDALNKITGIANGMLPEHITIQYIKANSDN